MGFFDKRKAVPQSEPPQQKTSSLDDMINRAFYVSQQQFAEQNKQAQEKSRLTDGELSLKLEEERRQRELEAAKQQADRQMAMKYMAEHNAAKQTNNAYASPVAQAVISGQDVAQRVSAAMNDNYTHAEVQATVKMKPPVKPVDTTAEIEIALVGASSVIGRREYQQDMISTSRNDVKGRFKEKWLAVLCDGMGGMNGGEKASFLCAHRMLSSFNQQITDIPTYFRNKIIEIDREVSELTDENGQPMGAGSTFISVIIDGDNLYWSSVGDSHIYIMRGNEFVQVNREHNYLAELLERAARGEITVEEAYNDRQREALTSYMGIGGVTLMDIIEKPFKLQKGDVIILCSDGLYRSLSDAEIFSIVQQNIKNMPAAANNLTAAAMAKNFVHQDNTSVITVRYQ